MSLKRELEDATAALREGRFVCIHDGNSREDETDMVVAAQFLKPYHIATMSMEAGGLVCLALSYKVAKILGIPYMKDILRIGSRRFPVLSKLVTGELPYGGKDAFSITVNHRATYTGISDGDRALTISELARLCHKSLNGEDGLKDEFARNFRSPGHVHLLIANHRLMEERAGHTELSVYLSKLAGLIPAAVVCEMLDRERFTSLSSEFARSYARKKGFPYIEGEDIVQHYLSSKRN